MLKRVSIQNFKSLKDVTLDLQKVNLLIGPNNSGKTNFLKALEFCKDADTIPEIFSGSPTPEKQMYYERERQIFNHLIYQKDKKLSINVNLHIQGGLNLVRTTYRIHWGAEIRSAKFIVNKKDSGLGSDRAFRDLKTDLQISFIYKPDPNKLTRPGPVGTGAETVNADASNLIGFLDRMLGNKYRKSVFNQIEADLHTCIPEFDEINIDDVQPTKELKEQFPENSFKRLGLTDSNQGMTYWADELSEGTLYFLALLCIFNQPTPPKLLLLEEPERGIHPRRIREVMDFIFRLADEKDVQIILTSHNEHVLDDFATRPEAVFVFDKDEEGATYVRNLQKDIIEPTNQRNRELGLDEIDLTTNLSENWLYGLLGGVPAIP